MDFYLGMLMIVIAGGIIGVVVGRFVANRLIGDSTMTNLIKTNKEQNRAIHMHSEIINSFYERIGKIELWIRNVERAPDTHTTQSGKYLSMKPLSPEDHVALNERIELFNKMIKIMKGDTAERNTSFYTPDEYSELFDEIRKMIDDIDDE